MRTKRPPDTDEGGRSVGALNSISFLPKTRVYFWAEVKFSATASQLTTFHQASI